MSENRTRTLELNRETVVRLRDAGKQHVHQLESGGETEWANNVDEAVAKMLWQWNKHSVKDKKEVECCPVCGSKAGERLVIGDDGRSAPCENADCRVSMFVVEPYEEVNIEP